MTLKNQELCLKLNNSILRDKLFSAVLMYYKQSWRVNVRSDEFELEDYSQDPCEELLLKHLQKRYPGANFQVAYEAGFCGFGIQRSLKSSGVPCMVVNPADVPLTDKDKKRKSDRVDARKISRICPTTCCGPYMCHRLKWNMPVH